MTIEILSRSASTENRQAARQWVDAFNARDDEGEADARTADYIGHAPDSMRLPALDSNAWVAFLGTGPAAMEAYCRFEHVCGRLTRWH